jgi:hypothetical protein
MYDRTQTRRFGGRGQVLVLLAVPLLTASVFGQHTDGDEQQGSVIYEAPPALLPAGGAHPDESRLQDADGEIAVTARPRSVDLAGAFVKARNIRELEPLTQERIQQADARAHRRIAVSPGPKRVGVVRSLGAKPVSPANDDLVATELPDGTRIHTLAIRSPGAHGLRLRFTRFDLKGAAMIVYGVVGQRVTSRGPFSGSGPEHDGNFWTAYIPGDTAYLETTGDRPPRFEVPEIVHFDRDPGAQDADSSVAGVLGCHLDVMCESSIDAVTRQATGQMNFVADGQAFVCSGTLLNDLDGGTVVPYFLTAAHCLNTQSQVDTLAVVWFWQRNSCGGTLPMYANLPRSTGGSLVSTLSDNDHTLIRLNGGLPGGLGFAGWTTATSIDNAYGVHHPGGSWKRAVFLDPVGVCPGCTCVSGSNYDYYNYVDGATEGGSSGSGVFSPTGQLAGQLRGCCPDPIHHITCDDRNCTNIDEYWAVYGEFQETYPHIRLWLEIGGTIHVDASFQGLPLGTPASPFPSIAPAYATAWGGSAAREDPRISIRPGHYPEALTFSKKVTLIHGGGAGAVLIGQ